VSQALERIRKVARERKKERFTALFHHINAELLEDVFFELSQNAAPGVDRLTWRAYEADLERNIEDLHERVQRGAYRALPSRRVYIPKPDGRQRPLAVAALEDKIVQRAVSTLLNAIYEGDFLGFSYGFRPGRGAHDALDALCVGMHSKKVSFVLDADIRSFFDEISQQWLIRFLEHRIGDRRIIRLIQKWLKAGILEDGVVAVCDKGTGQGSVISPLLANIYLNALDVIWERQCRHLGQLVRYADDAVVLCRDRAAAAESLRRLGIIMDRLSLKLHPDKTRIVELGLGKQGFVFLGCYLRIVLSHFKRREYLLRWPASRAMNRIRARVRELTQRRRWARVKDIRQVVEILNPVLRGWGNYFRTGNASWKFQQVDRYVNQRLVRLLRHVRGWRRRPFALRDWPPARFTSEFGLHRLVGTIRYPGLVNAS